MGGLVFWSGRRGKRRSAACGRCSKPLSRQRPVWRPRMWPPDGWRNGKTADALPAAGKARRFLGCVLTGGHKCDGQSDDTTRAAQPSRRRGSLAALSAATRTRAPKRATGTFFSLRSCPVRASARVIPKRNTILSDGVSFWSGRRGSNSLPRPWQGRALPDELRPQTQD